MRPPILDVDSRAAGTCDFCVCRLRPYLVSRTSPAVSRTTSV